MLRVAICDDDERVIADLKSIIEEEYPGKMQVALVQDVEDYLEQIKEQNELVPDITIMDIQWEKQEKNGIEYSVEMQRLFPKLKVIFLTGYINYASDIFSASPSHFLVKPVQRVKLKEALGKAMLEIEEERGNQIALHTSGEVIKVNPSYVFYIISYRNGKVKDISWAKTLARKEKGCYNACNYVRKELLWENRNIVLRASSIPAMKGWRILKVRWMSFFCF